MKLKVMSVFGARPQFVKAALVSRELAFNKQVEEVLVNTGQHYDALMSDVFIDELKMPPPKYSLNVGSGLQGAQTARILELTEKILLDEQPDCAVVFGDTNSTLGGSLAAAKLHIPLAHVEAGLRSFNRQMPEELNRIVADHLSDLLLAPSAAAQTQLISEGIAPEKIQVVGDVMRDAVLAHQDYARQKSTVLERLKLNGAPYVLVTIHRAENTDDVSRLKCLMTALGEVSKQFPVVFPIHPRTQKAIRDAGIAMDGSFVKVIEPAGYLDMVALESGAAVIATDSGGVQKEAFFLGVPCVTLRDETEWTELIDCGWNRLAPPDRPGNVARTILSSIGSRGKENVHPYGDGSAAARICDAIIGLCGKRQEGPAGERKSSVHQQSLCLTPPDRVTL